MTTKKKDQEVTGWVGWVAFAGFLAILMGTFHAVAGVVALFKDEVYAVGPNNVWVLDYTTWGWTHLILGLVVLFAGFAILSGKTWGRVVGVVVASVSAFANFAFIPVYPIWSIILIALAVFVIFALVAHGDEISLEE